MLFIARVHYCDYSGRAFVVIFAPLFECPLQQLVAAIQGRRCFVLFPWFWFFDGFVYSCEYYALRVSASICLSSAFAYLVVVFLSVSAMFVVYLLAVRLVICVLILWVVGHIAKAAAISSAPVTIIPYIIKSAVISFLVAGEYARVNS